MSCSEPRCTRNVSADLLRCSAESGTEWPSSSRYLTSRSRQTSSGSKLTASSWLAAENVSGVVAAGASSGCSSGAESNGEVLLGLRVLEAALVDLQP